MEEMVKYLAPGGPFVVAGGALGWFLNWLRNSRKDAYARVAESTQKVIDSQNATIKNQSDRILHLEGRIDQLTLTMGQAFADGASTKADLAVALTKLEVANSNVARLEGEVAAWHQRWDAQFPKEPS